VLCFGAKTRCFTQFHPHQTTTEILYMEQPPRTAPTPITKSRLAQMAEIAALRLENARLQDPELPDYVLLWGASAKRLGITVDQTINIALLHRHF